MSRLLKQRSSVRVVCRSGQGAKLAWIVFAGLIFASLISAQNATSDLRPWQEADRAVVRLSPAAFPDIPQSVRGELERRGCTIPQVPGAQVPGMAGLQNVIRGEFAKPGQTDWAVLCSVNRVSSILVFWNGSAGGAADIEKREDIHSLQSAGGDRIVYSRLITPANAHFVTEHYEAYGGPKPPPLDHQGIDDAFVGKASVVDYFYQGAWLRLTGAD